MFWIPPDEKARVLMVHAESHDLIGWMTGRLLEQGHTEPKFHALARPAITEREATHRAITMAELVGQPIYVVHVSGEGSMRQIAEAQASGSANLRRNLPAILASHGARPRPSRLRGCEVLLHAAAPVPDSQRALWRGLATGLYQAVSSDHSAFRFGDTKGKLAFGSSAPFESDPARPARARDTSAAALLGRGGEAIAGRSTSSSRLPQRSRPRSSVSILARGQLQSARTPIWSFGIATAKWRSGPKISTTRWIILHTRAGWS